MNKKISVIVPVYNTSKYLEKCLESLLNQSYENMEIIIVDDGSTDCSGNICDDYAEKYTSKIIAIHTENQGLSAARNTGIKYATGEYIGFVDSDDWVETKMFEVLLDNLVNTQSDLSVCGVLYDFGDCKNAVKKSYERENYRHGEIFEQIINNRNFYGYAWNKLFRKSIMGDLEFDETLLSCEDLVFSVNYAARCKCAVSTREELYHYRQHQGSMTGDFRYNVRKLSVLDAYEMIMPIYKNESPDLLYVLEKNYLKININIKGRMCLSKIRDSILEKRLDREIEKFFVCVLKEKRNSIFTKLNIVFSKNFPGLMLQLKQLVLKSRYRGN